MLQPCNLILYHPGCEVARCPMNVPHACRPMTYSMAYLDGPLGASLADDPVYVCRNVTPFLHFLLLYDIKTRRVLTERDIHIPFIVHIPKYCLPLRTYFWKGENVN